MIIMGNFFDENSDSLNDLLKVADSVAEPSEGEDPANTIRSDDGESIQLDQ